VGFTELLVILNGIQSFGMRLCFCLQVIWGKASNLADHVHLKMEAELASETFPPLEIKTMNKGQKKKKMVSLSREKSSRVYRSVQSSMSAFTESVAGKTVCCNLSMLSTSRTAP